MSANNSAQPAHDYSGCLYCGMIDHQAIACGCACHHDPLLADCRIMAKINNNRPQPPALTPIEFADVDHDRAEEIARRLGYEQTAYTSSSALWGLFCLPENPANNPHSWRVAESGRFKPPFVHGCVIKLKEFGLVFVQTADDLGFEWKD